MPGCSNSQPRAENARRALLDSSAKVADRVLVGEIMSVDLDRYHHRILIDKGTHHGAFRGQALLSADGIVGQITRAEPFTSEAILISDPGHALPVEINRNGLRAIAVGSGDLTRLSLPFLPNKQTPKPANSFPDWRPSSPAILSVWCGPRAHPGASPTPSPGHRGPESHARGAAGVVAKPPRTDAAAIRSSRAACDSRLTRWLIGVTVLAEPCGCPPMPGLPGHSHCLRSS